jgi:hypothetical protein
MPFLRKFALNAAIFLVFLGVLWPVARLGWAWEPGSAAFVVLSAVTAAALFAAFGLRGGPPTDQQREGRRGVVFLVGFFSLLAVLALCALWTVGLMVWRYGLAAVMAADASREITVGVIGSLVLCVWYGLDRAFYPRRGEAEPDDA